MALEDPKSKHPILYLSYDEECDSDRQLGKSILDKLTNLLQGYNCIDYLGTAKCGQPEVKQRQNLICEAEWVVVLLTDSYQRHKEYEQGIILDEAVRKHKSNVVFLVNNHQAFSVKQKYFEHFDLDMENWPNMFENHISRLPQIVDGSICTNGYHIDVMSEKRKSTRPFFSLPQIRPKKNILPHAYIDDIAGKVVKRTPLAQFDSAGKVKDSTEPETSGSDRIVSFDKSRVSRGNEQDTSMNGTSQQRFIANRHTVKRKRPFIYIFVCGCASEIQDDLSNDSNQENVKSI